MKSYPNLSRLIFIIKILKRNRLTKTNLKERLENFDIYVSEKTLQRDFSIIKDLGYDLNQSGSYEFYIENDITHEIDILNKVKDQMNSSSLHQFITDENTLQAPPTRSTGILPSILKSISNRHSISFVYKKYNSKDKRTHHVAPLVLKEHNGQWHLLAFELDSDYPMAKVFGCDRIDSLSTQEQFEINLIDDNKQKILDFKNTLGASMPLSEWEPSKPYFKTPSTETIVLEVKENYLPYLKNNSVHYSQRISDDVENGFTKVYFKLIPNLELIKFILAQQGDIKIIEPVNLKKFVRAHYKNLILDIS
ncbi:helix-turn-helix transcriptional regulator [Mariniflexile sp.]|uniref:helix-turn-helix transcriptional regulator n=1 Tax=Mariniflexile sp. TaxID=1979402 RepID=UPI00356A29F3